MSIQNRYVPILKWRRAEQSALQALGDQEKKAITPLIELVMPTVPFYKKVGKEKEKKTIRKTQEEVFAEIVQKFKEKRIQEIPKELLQSWDTRPIFLDFTLLHEGQLTTQLKIDSSNKIISAGMDMGLKIIPVLNLNDDQKIKEAIASLSKKYNQGICVRITPSDLANTEVLNVE